MDVHLSVVVPVYNARLCLGELVRRMAVTLCALDRPAECILVDDASEDGSFEELVRLAPAGVPITIIRNENNLGQHLTIMRGLSIAQGRYSVVMDCDLQDAPEMIPLLLQRLEVSGAQAVIVRYSNYANGVVRFIMSRAFFALRRVRGASNSDPRLAVYRLFGPELKAHLLATYVKGMLLRDIFDPNRWAIEYFDATRATRFAGRSSYGIRSLVRAARGRLQ